MFEAAPAAAAEEAAAFTGVAAAAFRRRYMKKKRTRRIRTMIGTPATVPPTTAPILLVVFLELLLVIVVGELVVFANDDDDDAEAEGEKVFPAIELLVTAVVDEDEVTTVVPTKNAAAILGSEDKYAAERFPTPVHPLAQALTLQHPQKGGFVLLQVYHSDPEGHS